MARPECQPPEVPGARLCFGEPSLWPAKTAHHGRPRHPTKRDKPPVHCPPSRSSMVARAHPRAGLSKEETYGRKIRTLQRQGRNSDSA
jgi:hypothetical protein